MWDRIPRRCHALSGLVVCGRLNPGRCPGLVCATPLGWTSAGRPVGAETSSLTSPVFRVSQVRRVHNSVMHVLIAGCTQAVGQACGGLAVEHDPSPSA